MTDKEILKIEYPEIGNWARHYSTVRMTVVPFLITVSLGIMTFRWDDQQPIFIITSAVVWALAIWFLWYFSFLTIRAEEYLKIIRDGLSSDRLPNKHFFKKGAIPREQVRWRLYKEVPFRVGIILTFLYVGALVYWIFD